MIISVVNIEDRSACLSPAEPYTSEPIRTRIKDVNGPGGEFWKSAGSMIIGTQGGERIRCLEFLLESRTRECIVARTCRTKVCVVLRVEMVDGQRYRESERGRKRTSRSVRENFHWFSREFTY